jgi:hypothetical protein
MLTCVAACAAPAGDPTKTAAMEQCKQTQTGSNVPRRGQCVEQSDPSKAQDQRGVEEVRDRAAIAAPGPGGIGGGR